MIRAARSVVVSTFLLVAASASIASAQSKPLFTVSGVINNGALATFFACTNTDTVSVTVGVEVFDAGGTSLNTPSATAVSLSPNATVLFGTNAANPASFAVDANLAPGAVSKGSAHILTTSKKVVCTAFVADPSGNPPLSAYELTIAAKGKQKGD